MTKLDIYITTIAFNRIHIPRLLPVYQRNLVANKITRGLSRDWGGHSHATGGTRPQRWSIFQCDGMVNVFLAVQNSSLGDLVTD